MKKIFFGMITLSILGLFSTAVFAEVETQQISHESGYLNTGQTRGGNFGVYSAGVTNVYNGFTNGSMSTHAGVTVEIQISTDTTKWHSKSGIGPGNFKVTHLGQSFKHKYTAVYPAN